MKSFIGFIRWKDWGPGKTTIISGLCFYIAAAYQLPFATFASRYLLFLLFASAQSALGFVLNNWGDRELDAQQGKPNPFNEFPNQVWRLNFGLVVALAILSGLPFVAQPGFLPLWILWLFAAVAYSLPPLRFKTRGLPGLAFSFAAQWSLPVVIAFAAFGQLGQSEMWFWVLALTISGATLEIAHQRSDRQRDASTQAETFAVGISQTQIDRIYAWAVLLDKFAVGLITALASLALVALEGWWNFGISILLGCGYLVLLALSIPGAWRALRGSEIQDPYYSSGRSFARLLHETWPNFGLPMTLLLALSLQTPAYFLLLALFGIWRLVLGGAEIGGLVTMIKRVFGNRVSLLIFVAVLVSLSCGATPGLTSPTQPSVENPATKNSPLPSQPPPEAPPQADDHPLADYDLQINYANVLGPGPSNYGVEYTWVDQASALYLERVADLHINTLRVQITQEVFEPVNDNNDPNFSEIDFSLTVPLDFLGGTSLTYEQMFTSLITANPNLHVQINVWLAGRWNASDPNGYLGLGGAFPPLDYAEHQEFIRELARWLVDTCGIPAAQLSFTFVNEPNLAPFFVGDTADLVQMATVTRTALDQVSTDIQIGGLDEVHGLTETNLFYPLRPTGCCDFWTFHVYEFGVGGVIAQLLGVAQQLESYGPVWVTEFADMNNGSPDAQMDFSTPEAALGFAEMIGQVWGSGLDGFIHFRLSDTYAGFPPSPAQWAGHGLFADAQGTHADGEPYAIFPVYYVFANLFRELGGGEIVTVGGSGNLPIVAARHATGNNPRLAIWITNPGSSSNTYTLDISNFPSGESGAQVRRFDNLSSNQPISFEYISGDPLIYSLTVPAESSYLLVITPSAIGELEAIYLPLLSRAGRGNTFAPAGNLATHLEQPY